MAAKRKKMHHIRSILEMIQRGYSQRQVSRDLCIHRNTIRKYLKHIQEQGSSVEEILKSEGQDFEKFFSQVYKAPQAIETERYILLNKEIPDLLQEMRRKGVTRQLLYEEYEKRYGENKYSRSQFFKYIGDQTLLKKATMKMQHIAGEKMYIDFCGDKLSYIDRDSGEIIECEVLVCTLGYSGMTFAIPVRSQKLEDLIWGICFAVSYFEGVPQCIVVDNLKSAVKKSSRYEPILTDAIELLGLHYKTTIMATRPYKPKDKAHVERSVNIVYQRIFAPLRDEICYSLEELREKVLIQADELNDRKLSQGHRSRREMFLQEEKPVLKLLPEKSYQIQHITYGKVQLNYHVILGADFHQYSVPYQLIGKRLKIIYTIEHVEIYHDLERVALHKRNRQRRGYTTLKDHMPANHQAIHQYNGWDAEYFLKRAMNIGLSTYEVVNHILKGRTFIQQNFNSCMGVLNLAKNFTSPRLENACAIALKTSRINYNTVLRILNNKMDLVEESMPDLFSSLPTIHENLRGASYYQ